MRFKRAYVWAAPAAGDPLGVLSSKAQGADRPEKSKKATLLFIFTNTFKIHTGMW